MTAQPHLVQVKVEIGHKATLRPNPTPDGFTHDWTIFVRGQEGSPIYHFVEKVIFYLHESFPKPKRVVKDAPYQVCESGYAGFVLPVELYFKNKEEPKKIRFEYDLFLQGFGAPPVYNSRCEKLTFQNPTEEFKEKLLKAGALPSAVPGPGPSPGPDLFAVTPGREGKKSKSNGTIKSKPKQKMLPSSGNIASKELKSSNKDKMSPKESIKRTLESSTVEEVERKKIKLNINLSGCKVSDKNSDGKDKSKEKHKDKHKSKDKDKKHKNKSHSGKDKEKVKSEKKEKAPHAIIGNKDDSFKMHQAKEKEKEKEKEDKSDSFSDISDFSGGSSPPNLDSASSSLKPFKVRTLDYSEDDDDCIDEDDIFNSCGSQLSGISPADSHRDSSSSKSTSKTSSSHKSSKSKSSEGGEKRKLSTSGNDSNNDAENKRAKSMKDEKKESSKDSTKEEKKEGKEKESKEKVKVKKEGKESREGKKSKDGKEHKDREGKKDGDKEKSKDSKTSQDSKDKVKKEKDKSKTHKDKDDKSSKDSKKDTKDGKTKEGKSSKDKEKSKENKDVSKSTKDVKSPKSKSPKDIKDTKLFKDIKDTKSPKDSIKSPKETKDSKHIKEEKDIKSPNASQDGSVTLGNLTPKERKHEKQTKEGRSSKDSKSSKENRSKDTKDRDTKSKDTSDKNNKNKESRKDKHEKARDTNVEGKSSKISDSSKSQTSKEIKNEPVSDLFSDDEINGKNHDLDTDKKIFDSDDSDRNESSSLRLTPESSPMLNSSKEHKDSQSGTDPTSDDDEFTLEELEQVAGNGYKVKILCNIMNIINASQNRELVQKVANLASEDTNCFVENGHFKFDLMNVSATCMRKIQAVVNKCTDIEDGH